MKEFYLKLIDRNHSLIVQQHSEFDKISSKMKGKETTIPYREFCKLLHKLEYHHLNAKRLINENAALLKLVKD